MVNLGIHNFPYLISSLKRFSCLPSKDSIWTLEILEVFLEELDFESWEGI